MAYADSSGSAAGQGQLEGRERGARRKRVYGYLKAANEMRHSYQSSWSQQETEDYDQGVPGAFPDVEIVRNGDEEMILFPSYARKHIKTPKQRKDRDLQHPSKPGAHDPIARPDSPGDAEFWKKEWQQYEDDNAIVDVDVRGWIYSPHKGPITRKNRVIIAVARRLSGIPADNTTSPSSSREPSQAPAHRESLSDRASRHEEEAAARAAESIIMRGEGEADAAWRGSYSGESIKIYDGDSPGHSRPGSIGSINDPIPGNILHLMTDSRLSDTEDDPGLRALTKRNSWRIPANMSKDELHIANSHLMQRIKPFMSTPLSSTPITIFFFNDFKSQSRSINTDESGHFSIRASLDFIPTAVRVLASEKLSATESVTILDHKGVSLISDIDDTIKHSAIASGAREIFQNTFIRELGDMIIPGVKDWYGKLSSMGVQLHYVSNSPWQLFPVLKTYFLLAGLPHGTFHLKQYTGMLQGIFEPAAERKKGNLEKIMRDFPERMFILVGDSGEADLEVYTEMVMLHPKRVLAVFIRDVTTKTSKKFFDPTSSQAAHSSQAVHRTSDTPSFMSSKSDAPHDRPGLPPRSATEYTSYKNHSKTQGTLIDFDDSSSEASTSKDQVFSSDLLELGEKKIAPHKPVKPSGLRSTSISSPSPSTEATVSNGNQVTTSSPLSKNVPRPSNDSSGRETKKMAPPPPKARRPEASIMPNPSSASHTIPLRAPFSADRLQKPRPSPGGRTSTDRGTPTLRNKSSSNSSNSPHDEESYTASAYRHINSTYQNLPSARSLFTGAPASGTTTPADYSDEESNRPSRRREGAIANIASYPMAAAKAFTGASGGDPAAGGSGGAPPGSSYTKKLEIWKRRWERAEEIMKGYGVHLRTWRVGADAMDDCVMIVQAAQQRIRQHRESMGGRETERRGATWDEKSLDPGFDLGYRSDRTSEGRRTPMPMPQPQPQPQAKEEGEKKEKD